MALDFKAALTRAFNFMLGPSIYGDTLIYNGKSYSCIAPPIEQTKKMTNAAYDENLPATFQMLATDLDTAGIAVRATISHNSRAFEVFAIVRDNRDGSVELRTYLKQ